jgi:hypothetical protein
MIFMMLILYLRSHNNLFMKAQQKIFYLLIVVGELEGFEWFIRHLSHTDPKVCNVLFMSC